MAPLPTIRTIRDYMTFEEHVRNARARRGATVPDEWYEGPTFYYSSATNLYGDGDDVAMPAWTKRWDFELELACVVGEGGRDIAPADAERHIAGFTLFNDWSARDLQRTEMAVGLGPSKSKEFAQSIGPRLATVDDLAARRVEPGVWDIPMRVRVNGREVTTGNARHMRWNWCELIAHASRDCMLEPGDLLGSGTVGGGCLLEHEDAEWLAPGDLVELEAEGIGVLANRVAAPQR